MVVGLDLSEASSDSVTDWGCEVIFLIVCVFFVFSFVDGLRAFVIPLLGCGASMVGLSGSTALSREERRRAISPFNIYGFKKI